jgi:hypothetical protein
MIGLERLATPASALGMTILPTLPTLLLRADEVIE